MNLLRHAVHKIEVFLRWAAIVSKRVVRFVTHDIWYLNLDDFGRWKARLIQDVRIVYLMLSTFARQKIGYQVTALSYRSMMSVVPFLAIAFYLTGGLGLSGRLSAFLYENIDNQRLIDALLNAADNILVTAESGLFGFISMFSFLWIVIALMLTVRKVFNNVWRVEREGNFLKLIGFVIVILLLSPFVVLLFFAGSVVYSHLLDLVIPESLFSTHLKSFLSWVLFAAASVLILSAMYKYIPGTKVHYRCAFKAAFLSGLVFVAVQYLYLETQVMVAKQSAVYGALAAIPLFMIWLNLGWSIVLYGAELSYAFQEVERRGATGGQLDELITNNEMSI